MKFKSTEGEPVYKGSTGPEIGLNNPRNPHNNLMYSEVRDVVKNLTGKIFTLLDASVENERQLKSMKDCIRGNVAETYSVLDEMAFGKRDLLFPQNVVPAEISLEEAVGV